MKKLLATVIICGVYSYGQAQFFNKIKDKINQKVNNAIDDATSGKKGKKSDPPKPDSTGAQPEQPGSPAAAEAAPAGAREDIKAYSKFDFVPGEKIIVEENFSQDPIGEFPDKWNTKTSAEVVTLSNKPGKWLAMKQDGIFFPEYIQDLPDNFTLQVDIMASNGIAGIGTLTVALAAATNTDDKFQAGYTNNNLNIPGIKLDLAPRYSGEGQISYSTNALGHNAVSNQDEFHTPDKLSATLSIWRQKQRVRVYLNSAKLLDLPRALEPGAVLNSLVFGAYSPDYDKKGGVFYISNIRLAVGAPDTRNKLMTAGKFVTHGILFDVNSDRIKPQSSGALQDIANALQANPGVSVRIVGHTDSDGDDKINLDLSKRRADAVKAMLVSGYSIDGSRMETDGKGKTQPMDSNDTPAGKANNRRVEFIKL